MMGDGFPRPLVFAVLFLASLHLTISILLRKGPTLHPSHQQLQALILFNLLT